MGQLAQRIKQKYPQYASVPDDQLEAKIVAKYPVYAPMVKQKRTMKDFLSADFLGNVVGSGARAVGDIASGVINVVNPDMEKNTIANLAKLGIDTAKLVAGDKDETNRAKQLVTYYKDRYGKDFVETLYNDPVGVALDASTVLGGAGALAKAGKMGTIGGKLSTASRVVDPLQIPMRGARAVAQSKPMRALAESTKGSRQNMSKFFAGKSIKANPSQRDKFREMTGMDIDDYMVQNNIYTKADVEKQIAKLQPQYNELVRTDTNVNVGSYADRMRKEALKILENDRSAGAEALAEKLWKEADRQESMGAMTDTVLTNTKSNQYNKASQTAMLDPLSDNMNKKLGQLGVQALDEYAPGSAKIGKELQKAREFDEIVRKQGELGKGAQLFNLFKPAAGGIVSGAAIGGFSGNSAPAAIAGGLAMGAANMPSVQRAVSKITGKKIAPIQVGQGVGKGFANAREFGKVDRMLTPETTKKDLVQSIQPQLQQESKKAPYNAFTTAKAKTIKQPKYTVRTSKIQPYKGTAFGKNFELKKSNNY